MGDRQAYVVVANRKCGGSGEDLRALVQEAANDARIKVQRVSGEPPATVRLEAPPALAEAMKRKYGDKIIIEEDRPLRLM